jgi:hypothetical protein
MLGNYVPFDSSRSIGDRAVDLYLFIAPDAVEQMFAEWMGGGQTRVEKSLYQFHTSLA